MKLFPTQIIIIGLSLLVSGFVLSSSALQAQTEAKRWVEIRVIKGSVTYQGQPARVGDRLAVGEKLSLIYWLAATLLGMCAIATAHIL